MKSYYIIIVNDELYDETRYISVARRIMKIARIRGLKPSLAKVIRPKKGYIYENNG